MGENSPFIRDFSFHSFTSLLSFKFVCLFIVDEFQCLFIFAFSEKYQQNSKTIYTTENVYFTNFLIYTYLMKHCLVVTEFEKKL